MFDATKARLARNLEQAEDNLIAFLAREIGHDDRQAHQHSHDYDLYLPWFLEVISYVPVPEGADSPLLTEIDHLYMDAAWSLVVRGFIRPGPRAISSIDTADGLGKGFSLTPEGRQRVLSSRLGEQASPLV